MHRPRHYLGHRVERIASGRARAWAGGGARTRAAAHSKTGRINAPSLSGANWALLSLMEQVSAVRVGGTEFEAVFRSMAVKGAHEPRISGGALFLAFRPNPNVGWPRHRPHLVRLPEGSLRSLPPPASFEAGTVLVPRRPPPARGVLAVGRRRRLLHAQRRHAELRPGPAAEPEAQRKSDGGGLGSGAFEPRAKLAESRPRIDPRIDTGPIPYRP